MSDDERAIRDVMARWMTATSSGDVETVLTLMSDDATFLVPGRPPFGKAEFAAGSRAMRDVKVEGTNDIVEIEVFGDWAFCISCVAGTVTPRDGAPFRRAGHTLSLFRRGPDGRWLLARDANLMAGG